MSFLVLSLLMAFGSLGCATTNETQSTTTPSGAGGETTVGQNIADGSGGTASGGGSDSTSPSTPGSGGDRAAIESRLALPPFAYVAETDVKADTSGTAASAVRTAAFAVVDSLVDTLAARPECAGNPVNVAVAPDGGLVYVTDWSRPVVHVLDAETQAHLRDIDLPGVRAPDLAKMQAVAMNPSTPVPGDWSEGCSTGIAVTPDGALLLVCTHEGLTVVDAATETVLRTLSDIHGLAVAVSFDGRRAYLGTDDWATRDPRPVLEWLTLRNQGVGGALIALDLETWEVVKEVPIGFVNGIAMKPDDTEVFVSDHTKRALRMVDAVTLEDRGLVPLGTSFPVGVGVLPDSSKAYVVCTADTTELYAAATQYTAVKPPSAEDYFCAVVDVEREELIKQIPLESY
ncbi:MAG: SMP-30/gluconolactonase/LRE family protein [Actinobacteria bacterium]|nr:SMP-30/gluconolactonase/LRE family protein [Actinomycetota bacterium]